MKAGKEFLEKKFPCEETFANFILLKRAEDISFLERKFVLKKNRMALCDRETLEKFI